MDLCSHNSRLAGISGISAQRSRIRIVGGQDVHAQKSNATSISVGCRAAIMLAPFNENVFLRRHNPYKTNIRIRNSLVTKSFARQRSSETQTKNFGGWIYPAHFRSGPRGVITPRSYRPRIAPTVRTPQAQVKPDFDFDFDNDEDDEDEDEDGEYTSAIYEDADDDEYDSKFEDYEDDEEEDEYDYVDEDEDEDVEADEDGGVSYDLLGKNL